MILEKFNDQENKEILSISFSGNVHKVEFDPFDSQKFILLFENNMVAFSRAEMYWNLCFGKFCNKKKIL